MTKTSMLFGAALFGAMQAWGEIVSYLDEKGEMQTTNATVIVASDIRETWNMGWYAVTNAVTIAGGVYVNGAVKLILVDGAKLTISTVGTLNSGIYIDDDSGSLAVYGQVRGTGELDVTGGDYTAGIAGWGRAITINGGTVKAQGGSDCAGIGGSLNSLMLNVTINGGTVMATGGFQAAGIGCSSNGRGGNITINGGTVTTTGGDFGAGIGGGFYSTSPNITINGGTVTATGGYNGAGIGGGKNSSANITINGGTVTATSGQENVSGIGGGFGSSGESVYIGYKVVLRAGDSPNPKTVAARYTGPTTDVSSSLAGKQYATARETFDVSTWTDLKSKLEAGNDVVLVEDIVQDEGESQISLETADLELRLDLNGRTLTLNGTSRLVSLNAPETGLVFTLRDSVGSGVVTGGLADNGGCVWVGPGNAFVLESGKIAHCTASDEGGAVYNKGAFMMTGGTISENFAPSYGYAIRSVSGSGLTITGGADRQQSRQARRCSFNRLPALRYLWWCDDGKFGRWKGNGCKVEEHPGVSIVRYGFRRRLRCRAEQ